MGAGLRPFMVLPCGVVVGDWYMVTARGHAVHEHRLGVWKCVNLPPVGVGFYPVVDLRVVNDFGDLVRVWP